MTVGFETLPRVYVYAIGDNPSETLPGYQGPQPAPADPVVPVIDGTDTNDYNTVAVFQPVGITDRDQIQLCIRNYGPNVFTFSIQQSIDNGVATAYVAVNIRQGSSTSTSIVMQPGGIVVATLDPATLTPSTLLAPNFVRLVVPNASAPAYQTPITTVAGLADATGLKPFGNVVVTFFNGIADRVERAGIS